MHKVLLIGNPNVGKSTLFNSLTKSHEHTGNFHGVTVEEKRKRITFDGEEYEFVDLPGLYSLNTFSFEEEVSKNIILKEQNSTKILLVDANSLKRNLYLAVQMSELNLNYKILINNYDYFLHHGGKIDEKKLQQKFGVKVEIINAKKIKLNKELLNTYVDNSTKQNSGFVANSTKLFSGSAKIIDQNYVANSTNSAGDFAKIFEIGHAENLQKNFEKQKNEAKFTKNLQNLCENQQIFKNFSENNENFKTKQKKQFKNNFSYLNKFIDIVKAKFNLTNEQIIFAFNGEFKNLTDEQIELIRSLYPQIIEARYKFLDDILSDCMSVKKDFVYGSSRADKLLLNPLFMFAAFLLFFFASIYVIFFGVGPIISDFLIAVFIFLIFITTHSLFNISTY